MRAWQSRDKDTSREMYDVLPDGVDALGILGTLEVLDYFAMLTALSFVPKEENVESRVFDIFAHSGQFFPIPKAENGLRIHYLSLVYPLSIPCASLAYPLLIPCCLARGKGVVMTDLLPCFYRDLFETISGD